MLLMDKSEGFGDGIKSVVKFLAGDAIVSLNNVKEMTWIVCL